MSTSAAFPTPRTWSLWRLPGRLSGFIVATEILTAGCTAVAATHLRATLSQWAVLGLMFVLAFLFEEGATRVARLQWRLSSELKRDMTSVWAVAAAVALPAMLGVLLLVGVLAHVWWRQQRPGGQPVHRALFWASTCVLACLVAGTAVRAIDRHWNGGPWAVTGTLAVVAAITVYTLVNRLLISVALLWSGAPHSSLAGTLDDNLTELATLCLGGLVALAALHQPWLCALAVLPMAMLQRGAFVRELETAAVTDPKTGLLNAIGWEHLAQREFARASRDGYDVSVLIIDVDHFKRVNDRHGHLVGDQVLRGLSRTLVAALREYDTVARFGGEEFVAVLPETDELSAIEVAERIRELVNTVTVGSVSDVDSDDLVSVSIGVATTRPTGVPGTDLTSMLVAADRALYRAKGAGRNRVCLAADPEDQVDLHV